MLTQHIALVPETYGVNPSELARVSAALQKQVTRDLAPFWGVTATVDAFPKLEDVPVGYWPIVLSFKRLGTRAGVHLDRNGAPYAQIEMTALWPLHASRACLEMLINPYGMRTVSARSPRADQGPVDLLVEICAPCQDARYAYNVNDLLLSDFCTPAFFGETSASSRHSFTGAIDYPFQVLPGGHVTWRDALSDRWWRKSYHDDLELDAELDAARPRFGAPRAIVSGDTQLELPPDTVSTQLIERTNASLHLAQIASQAAAQRLRHQLDLPSGTPYGSQHFEMLIDMLNKDEAPTATTPPAITAPSIPPPLPSSPQRMASAAPTASAAVSPAATQILWSLPESAAPQPISQATPTQPPPQPAPQAAPTTTSLPAPSLAAFAVASAGPRPSNDQDAAPSPLRTAGLVVGGALAAVGLLVVFAGARDRFLPSPRVDTPPAYAVAPAAPPTPALAATPVVTAPVVAAPAIAAPVVTAPAIAAPVIAAVSAEPVATAPTIDDADTEARRARRRAKREATAEPAVQASATAMQSPADPLDSLLDTRQ